MAYDSYDYDRYLTPEGWSLGDERPADCVEEWHVKGRQQSGWSKEYVTWTCTWASPDWAREKRDELRR